MAGKSDSILITEARKALAEERYQGVIDMLLPLSNNEKPSAFYREIGFAYLGLEEFSQARLHLKKACEVFPQSVQLMTNLSVSLAGGGEVEEALSILRQATQVDPTYLPRCTILG